ncbi:glutathione S-transferase family protein [Otariodibacter oris]|uniref:glutathione transferase n=1 Tax=Otariodibacter oris TaxID=1032623 RepID=A0A420XG73_9PAST|nr:glutathione S-transferase family protein [Otariodibacter oris]QGM79989.1 glutathione S-transferase [Otariodibacter oris]RKR71812.1 glutathione S-transferase [Otariodibacter oris]
MIKLHHLNQSRSLRILWLLEELNQPYELVSYKRNKDNNLAPESLKQVHPLGKSPVIELDGQVIAESGAITELLIEKFASERLMPKKDTPEYAEYVQWIHFAESSLMVPLLLELFTHVAGVDDNPFLKNYTSSEKGKLLSYLDKTLENKSYIVGNKLSGADFMLAFNFIILNKNNQLENYPNIKHYIENLAQLDSFQRAMKIEEQNN